MPSSGSGHLDSLGRRESEREWSTSCLRPGARPARRSVCAELTLELQAAPSRKGQEISEGSGRPPALPAPTPNPARSHPRGRRKAGNHPPLDPLRAPPAPRTRPVEVCPLRGAPGLGGSGSRTTALRAL